MVSGDGADDGAMSGGVIAAVVISALSVLLATATTGYMYWQYLQHWTQPRTQTYVMWICSITPVWGVFGLFVNIFPAQRYIIKVFMDLYEGFIIVVFMTLIYWYLGGRDQAHWKAEHKEPYRCFQVCCWLRPGGKTMRFLHACIYQFAFSRPFFSLVICVLNYTGYWSRGTPIYLAVTAMTFGLLFLAMWALFQVYRIFALVLKPYNVGYKFLAIKLYIFLHALQGFIFGFVEDSVSSSLDDSAHTIELIHIEYTLFCVEMLLGSLVNTFLFFHVKEYIEPDVEQTDLKARRGASPAPSGTFSGADEDNSLITTRS